MHFRRSGVEDPTALEIPKTVRPIEFAKRSPLSRLNFLLSLVKQQYPKSLIPYAASLQQRYQGLVSSNLLADNPIDIYTLTSELVILRDFPTLAACNLTYFLQTLLSGTQGSIPDVIDVSQRNQLRALLCPKYQNLLVLAETIGRTKAIELYKIYHDKFMQQTGNSPGTKFETLEELAEQWFQEDTKNSPGLVRLVSDIDKGKIILRKDTCLWNDALEDLDDHELKYYVCCYGDYEAMRLNNPHFVMTMNHTIVEGHPYCDCVIHDTRINDNLTHPSDDYFASIKIK